MSHPSHIYDANFNEIRGTMVHEEDRRQTHYDNSRNHYNTMSGPFVSMPYHGHRGNSSGPGSVNIGVASGNLNTGMVYGTLHQSEGIRHTHVPQPGHALAPSFPSALPAPSPPKSSQTPRQQQLPHYQREEVSLRDGSRPPQFRHNGEQGPKGPPRPYQSSESVRSPKRERNGRDVPHYREGEERHRESANHERNRRDTRQHASYQEEPRRDVPQDHTPYQQRQAPPPMKSRNPFRNFSADSVPMPQPNVTPRPPAQQRAATTDYTSHWVADTNTYTYTRPPPLQGMEEQLEEPEDDASNIKWSLRSPSEYSASSSSASSNSPVFWSRDASRSSGGTTHSRVSPVPEEYGDGLYPIKPLSRSSSGSSLGIR